MYIHVQSDLYLAATLGTLKSGRLIEVGRLTEVQYKLAVNMILWPLYSKMLLKNEHPCI